MVGLVHTLSAANGYVRAEVAFHPVLASILAAFLFGVVVLPSWKHFRANDPSDFSNRDSSTFDWCVIFIFVLLKSVLFALFIPLLIVLKRELVRSIYPRSPQNGNRSLRSLMRRAWVRAKELSLLALSLISLVLLLAVAKSVQQNYLIWSEQSSRYITSLHWGPPFEFRRKDAIDLFKVFFVITASAAIASMFVDIVVSKTPKVLKQLKRQLGIDDLPKRNREEGTRNKADGPLSRTPPSRVESAQLKLRRSQRTGGIGGKIFFALDARMEVPPEQYELIAKYKLGDSLVYDSTNRKRYAEKAQQHLESTRDHAAWNASVGEQAKGLGKTLFRLGRAGVNATIAALSLRITIKSLMEGVHIECKSMDELLEAEEAIVSAARNLKSYLETAATFDGRESIIAI